MKHSHAEVRARVATPSTAVLGLSAVVPAAPAEIDPLALIPPRLEGVDLGGDGPPSPRPAAHTCRAP